MRIAHTDLSKLLFVAGIAVAIFTTATAMWGQRVGGECPRGTREAPTGCMRIEIPPNAQLDVFGHDWECKRGYRQSEERCVAVAIPENAQLDVFGHDWECKRGYRQAGERCVALLIPENAQVDVFGHDWECKRGYRQSGERCVVVQVPENAQLDVFGHDWECKRGYRLSAGRCGAIEIPENAALDAFGHDWVCKNGYKLVSGRCLAMSAEEFLESERMRAELMRRLRSDMSACEVDSEPIRGHRAEVVLKTLGCGGYFIADGPSGHYLLEWYGGYSPDVGDVLIGPINSYGFKTVCYPSHGKGRVWVDDFLLSRSTAVEKYFDKCR